VSVIALAGLIHSECTVPLEPNQANKKGSQKLPFFIYL